MKLLPNYFKKVGICIFLLTIVLNPMYKFLFYMMVLKSSVSVEVNHGLYDAMIEIGPYLGLLIYIFSREKVDDERIFKIRLESFKISFIGIAILISIYLFLDCILYPEYYDEWQKAKSFLSSPSDALLYQLIIYILSFEIKKRRA